MKPGIVRRPYRGLNSINIALPYLNVTFLIAVLCGVGERGEF